MVIQISSGGDVPGMNPQQMQQIQQLSEAGALPMWIFIPSAVCVMVIGSGLATIGGAILSAVKPD